MTGKKFQGLSVLLVLGIVGSIHGQAPPISDPDMMAPAGAMPGTFPESITAANVNAAPIPGSTIGGPGSNNIRVTFPASGPVAWTESRHNEGDIALQVGPFDPNDPSYFPPDDFVDDYRPLAGQPFENTTLAWRVNRDHGALLATVRHNGVDNGDFYNGQPLGTTHGIAYFNSDFGQGWGYRMNDGVFANGGNNSADLQLGVAGFDDGLGEAVFNTSVAMFPYQEGWQGAYVDAGSNGAASFSSGSELVDTTAVSWSAGRATVDLPGVDPLNDGMLFVAPTSGGNSSNIAAAFPSPSGWQVTIREDDDADFSGLTYNEAENGFQFLYVPYDTPDLIGGLVSGSDGGLVSSAGDAGFTVTRRGAGEYGIQIANAGEIATEDNGMLILSVAGALPGSSTLADRKFLSYEFDENTNEFVVQSRELVAINSPNSENAFGDFLELQDVDFYFAYVDFADPFGPRTLACDFDLDGVCNGSDIDMLVAEISAGSNLPNFDLTGDGLVDIADRDAWLAEAGAANLPSGNAYLLGDANLDGTVDGQDFIAWNGAKFTNTAAWTGGDFNADGVVDGQDFIAWNTNKFTSADGVSAVPEPAPMISVLLVSLLAWRRVSRQ